jgi:hypothetical protein
MIEVAGILSMQTCTGQCDAAAVSDNVERGDILVAVRIGNGSASERNTVMELGDVARSGSKVFRRYFFPVRILTKFSYDRRMMQGVVNSLTGKPGRKRRSPPSENGVSALRYQNLVVTARSPNNRLNRLT